MKALKIRSELDVFIRHIDSLHDTLDFLMEGVSSLRKPSALALKEFLIDNCDTKVADNGGKHYTVPPNLLPKFRRLRRRSDRLTIAYRTLPRTFVVSLVSQFDSFLGGLVRALLYAKPELLNSSERPLTFKQLSSFESLESAREFIVDKEVESLLRKSHSEQFDWLENKFGLPLRKGLDSWARFVEVTERRNLFVHCNGVVSSQYLEVCNSNDVEVKKGIVVGKELDVNKRYFREAYECLYEIGVKLAHVLWRKILVDQKEEADGHLVIITVDLIRDGHYGLAKRLVEFAFETPMRFSSERYRRMFVINRAQVYKWTGDEKRAQEIIKKEDWSAADDRFKLAVAVIDNDFVRAGALMAKVPESDIAQISYRDWPLFRVFQKSEPFLTAYQAKFGEPFEQLDAEVTDKTLTERQPDQRDTFDDEPKPLNE